MPASRNSIGSRVTGGRTIHTDFLAGPGWRDCQIAHSSGAGTGAQNGLGRPNDLPISTLAGYLGQLLSNN
jgi:hypothetical protein